ncbi:DHHA2 domain-containing protein [Skeletonema marinoi]|uniref:DHHA2 domain-containing protein n=1 Tax=Skeletonema marinoi TaxID=267567 RepID=A0AAD8YCH6_9STRA|nr:DHHA2 domain-containing protein [Skeletonema marinoi]|mmetsp:Transcript_8781/g.14954  ORF Transcript_8781/g.14954 Transcript_8781/m.14954 type:complete len:339 (+) Transcript_8781:1675-2691(+)
MLLDLAGISNASANLLFIEDLQMILDSSKDNEVRTLTLVDHNTINDSLHKFRHMIEVVEIVDHHTDENLYTDTCSGTMRNIAFENGKALVASTATLIAEMLLKRTSNPPVSLSTLLLGVILLDSVNLDESIGKVTPRDRDAVSNILTQTDWSNSSLLAYLKPSAGSQLTIDTNQLFSHLERAKYSPEFWSAFDVSRALGYDYKAFHYGRNNSKHRFGISTILMGNQFMEKEGFLPKTAEFMRSKELTFLGIMLTFYDQTTGDFRRQLAFCSNRYRWGVIGDDLIESKMYTYLALKEITSQQLTSDEIVVHVYEQHNLAPSRKQLGPMLVEFFVSEQDK